MPIASTVSFTLLHVVFSPLVTSSPPMSSEIGLGVQGNSFPSVSSITMDRPSFVIRWPSSPLKKSREGIPVILNLRDKSPCRNNVKLRLYKIWIAQSIGRRYSTEGCGQLIYRMIMAWYTIKQVAYSLLCDACKPICTIYIPNTRLTCACIIEGHKLCRSMSYKHTQSECFFMKTWGKLIQS